MRTALLFRMATRQSEVVTAERYLEMLDADPDLAEKTELRVPGTDVPVHVRRGHTRLGNEQNVRPHFARAAGYGDHDHIFERERETLEEAVRSGKMIVLSLNTDLSHLALNFRGDLAQDCMTFEQFQDRTQGEYVTVSVRSAREAVERIKAIRALDPKINLNDRVVALHRGGVIPYKAFYLGNRDEDIAELYAEMEASREGVAHGETRVVGFPRLIRFVATASTKREEGRRGLKGNRIDVADARAVCFSQLVFSDARARRTAAYRQLEGQVLQNLDGVYVLACPSITVGRERDPDFDWQQLRWIITDIRAQTSPAIRNGQTPAPTTNGQAAPAHNGPG